MSTKRIAKLVAPLVLLAVSFGMPGCSRVYHITFMGELKTIEGNPIEGVHVQLDGSRRDEHNVRTDETGRFLIRLKVFENELAGETPIWSLTFAKEGFRTDTCEINPGLADADPKAVDIIIVKLYLRPELPD